MSRNIDWKTVAELVGVTAIVASIIFLAVQIQQSQQIAANERSYSSVENQLTLNMAIIDHAAIWIAGNAGHELDPVEATVYASLIANHHWVHWSAFRSAEEIDLDTPRELVITDFAAFLHSNPGALDAWRKFTGDRESVRQALIASYDQNPFVLAVEKKLAELSGS